MTRLLDSGVWLAARDAGDRFHDASAELVRDAPLAALDLTLYEVADIAVVRWRSETVARNMTEAIRIACGPRLIRIDQDLADAAITTAALEGLTAYDAAYVACARREGWQLVSTDIADLVRPGLALSPDAARADSAP